MSSTAATCKDIDDVLHVLGVMMTRIDERFSKIEGSVAGTQGKVQSILTDVIINEFTALKPVTRDYLSRATEGEIPTQSNSIIAAMRALYHNKHEVDALYDAQPIRL